MNELANTLSKNKWERIGAAKRAGILVPLFSVYSEKSAGIGDLADLKLLVDFCAKTGNSILQLLPMNEVGSTFCPYDAVSSFAIEPAYVSLEDIPGMDAAAFKKRIVDLKKRFSAGKKYVDYGVKDKKIDLMWDLFYEEGGASSAGYKEFRENNSYWLDDFAVFKTIKEFHEGKPWYEWEDGYRERDPSKLEFFENKFRKEIAFERWMQWVLYGQFVAAKAYAASKGVFIKGDLPVLISRDSADVWAHKEFFKLDLAAGAPPDMYCAKGQRWGMPTYSWSAIESDGYKYVKERMAYAGNFYDIIRIDHVVGLFRIWSIPCNDLPENAGINGFFDPRDEKEWEAHGKRSLSVMLHNTDMLLCSEDLGMIPDACPKTLKEYGIPGNDVQRWTKDWAVRHDFLPPEEYRLLSVAMISTHDTTNCAAWWENEAGTVDEQLFKAKCGERGIDYDSVKDEIFDSSLSRHGRLRWLTGVDSVDAYMEILGKKRSELPDFIDMYENTFMEKEKLWKMLGLKGSMREESDDNILGAVMEMTFRSRSIFCIQLIFDWLGMAGLLKGDPYQYRVNMPGTVSDKNWSLTIPLSLDKLIGHDICGGMKELISGSGRE